MKCFLIGFIACAVVLYLGEVTAVNYFFCQGTQTEECCLLHLELRARNLCTVVLNETLYAQTIARLESCVQAGGRSEFQDLLNDLVGIRQNPIIQCLTRTLARLLPHY